MKKGYQIYIIFLFAFLVALCSIVYELMFSQLLTILFGGTVKRYSITIGLFLCSLGLGSFLYGYIKTKPEKLFIIIELLITTIGFLGVLTIIKATGWIITTKFASHNLVLVLSYVPIILVGIISGIEIPLLTTLGQKISKQKNLFGKVLGWDYFGALMGTVLFALYLYPQLGIVTTAFIISFINLILAVYFAFAHNKKTYLRAIVLLGLVIYLFLIPQISTLQDEMIKDFRGKRIFHSQQINDIKTLNYTITELTSTQYQDIIFTDIDLNKDFYSRPPFQYKCLYLDNDLQFCSHLITSYHGGAVDYPMQYLDKDKLLDVLIIGGGDWIAVKHFLQFENINTIDLVDIDKEFTELAKTHPLIKPHHDDAFKSEKLNVYYEDGFAHVLNTKKTYDFILLDLPGISHDKLSHLYSIEFFSNINRILKKDAIAVSWMYNEGYEKKHHRVLMQTLYDAGFKQFLRYYAYTDKAATEKYMILANTPLKKVNLTSPYLLNTSWIYDKNPSNFEPIVDQNTTYHSIFKPNHEIIVRPPLL